MKTIWYTMLLLCCSCTALQAEIVSREGAGFLAIEDSQMILHLKGSPYDIGYQHGKLLKDKIALNISRFIDTPPKASLSPDSCTAEFLKALPQVMQFIPPHLMKEMEGVADGAEIPLQKILLLNLFPEMFHCTGITVSDKATKNNALYHVRVLDYSVGQHLQDTAVLMVVEAEGSHPFLNVSYAGFIGSVTGMNAQKIAIGEIGGKGYGYWKGIPMAFLMRQVLEEANSLKEALNIFENSPRTCEYFYVVSDGNTLQSSGVYATADQLHFIPPGSPYALLAPGELPRNYAPEGYDDKFFLEGYLLESSPYQTVVYQDEHKDEWFALFHKQPPCSIVMTGYADPTRYPVLVSRLMDKYGKITENDLQEIIKRPVAHQANLHNAIFAPTTLEVWIAHAGPNDEPACDQPYRHYSLPDLLRMN